MNLTIVIPVYNEGTTISKVVTGIETEVKVPHKLMLVYDSETDTTLPPAKLLQKKYPALTLVKNIYGKGALNAIKTGLKTATSDAVVVTMADCSDDPNTINAMFAKFKKGYDIVCGSRYMKGGKKIGGPHIKSFLSWFSGVTARVIMGLPTHDLTNSYKLYSKNMLEKITIESVGGFELGMEIILKGYFLHKAKITEVPTTWYDRTAGKSRFRLFAWLPRYVYWYLWGIKNWLYLHF